MTDSRIIVKKQFSVTDIEQARLARAAFRPSKATSQVSNLLNHVDLKKAIVVCEDHSRAFRAAAKRHGYYRQKEFPFVMGNCEYCQVYGRSDLYIHESTMQNVWLTRDRDRRDREYATVVSG